MIKPHYCKLLFILLVIMPVCITAKAETPNVDELSVCPDDILIDNARKTFKVHYDAKQYVKAIESMLTGLKKYENLQTCTAKQKRSERSINKLLWAKSDMAVASYQLKNPKQCLADITLFHDFISSGEDHAKNKAYQAYKKHVYQCLDLENVEKTIVSHQCEELYQDCLRLKDIVGYRVSSKYKSSQKDDFLTLSRFAKEGEIRIKTFEDKTQCPKIYWDTKNKKQELQIKEEYKHSLSDEVSCCNIDKDNLVLFEKGDSINLQVAYAGQDCSGEVGEWFTEEIYEINLDKSELIYKESYDIWYH